MRLMRLPLFVCLWSILLPACREHSPADTLLYNGRIYTLDSAFTTVEAMALQDGKIIDTGSSHYIRSNYRASANIDLQGKYVYPGLNDAHTHFYWYGIGLDELNLVGTRSFDEVLKRLQEYAESRHPEFIKGRGWDQNDWGQTDFPDNSELNRLFPETPVILTRVDGHATLVNDAAMRYAGISPDTSVLGGSLLYKGGRFTGILIDNATELVSQPDPSEEQGRQALLRAQDSLLKHGVTSLTDAGLEARQIELLRKMYKEKELKIRTNVLVSDKPELLDKFLASDPITGEYLNVGGFKFYLDGALGSRGALLLAPYSDDTTNNGLMLSTRSHFVKAARRVHDAGWQMAIHAIGDSANRLALSVYREVLGDSASDLRWRIEHAQVVNPEDIAFFGKLGVIPSVQPTHATSDMYWAEERLGKERMAGAYAYQSLLQSAGQVVLGTDFPVEDIDPRKTFVAAVFRQDSAAFPAEGFLPRERLTRKQALRGMTHWPAYASFEEDFKGRLLPGMVADFIVTESDFMAVSLEQCLQIEVLKTYIAGKQVFPTPEKPAKP